MSDKTAAEKLKSIPGEKIRRQYFNVVIYPIVLFLLLIVSVCVFNLLQAGTQDERIDVIATLAVVLLMVFVILVPLVVLSILNRFCFGRIVCVLNEKGLYFADGFIDEDIFFKADGSVRMIKWEHIRKVAYDPDGITFSGYATRMINRAYITVKPYKREVVAELNHVPFMLLRKMKKYCPDAKYGFTGFGWFIVGIYTVIPTIIPILAIFME